MSKRITCINKNPRHDPYNRISHFGCLSGSILGSTTVKYTSEELVRRILSGENFHTESWGKRAKIILGKGPAGYYPKSEADSTGQNNLLELPECIG